MFESLSTSSQEHVYYVSKKYIPTKFLLTYSVHMHRTKRNQTNTSNITQPLPISLIAISKKRNIRRGGKIRMNMNPVCKKKTFKIVISNVFIHHEEKVSSMSISLCEYIYMHCTHAQAHRHYYNGLFFTQDKMSPSKGEKEKRE